MDKRNLWALPIKWKVDLSTLERSTMALTPKDRPTKAARPLLTVKLIPPDPGSCQLLPTCQGMIEQI